MTDIDRENPSEILKLIGKLTSEEGSSIEIYAPNADFEGPSHTVRCYDLEGNTRQATGESILACLKALKR